MNHFVNAFWRLLDGLLGRLLGQVADYNPAISPQRLQQLTRRERQVTALVCLRYTNRQIARQLNISPGTVRTHVRAALVKLGLPNRAVLRQHITADSLYGGDRARLRAELGLGHSAGPYIMRPPGQEGG
jgi:DNA-binding CsgD family transcriptional regulator